MGCFWWYNNTTATVNTQHSESCLALCKRAGCRNTIPQHEPRRLFNSDLQVYRWQRKKSFKSCDAHAKCRQKRTKHQQSGIRHITQALYLHTYRIGLTGMAKCRFAAKRDWESDRQEQWVSEDVRHRRDQTWHLNCRTGIGRAQPENTQPLLPYIVRCQ